jgi:hypothetical protein
MGKEEFFDEQIIDMMNKAEQKKESSKVNQSETVEERNIYTGVRIFGKWIYFERSLLAKDTITMMLPKNFVPLDPDMTKNKYPSEHRPETILTDETGTIRFRLSSCQLKHEQAKQLSPVFNFFQTAERIFGI